MEKGVLVYYELEKQHSLAVYALPRVLGAVISHTIDDSDLPINFFLSIHCTH